MASLLPSQLSPHAQPPPPASPRTPFCAVHRLGQPCLCSSRQPGSRVFSLPLAPAKSYPSQFHTLSSALCNLPLETCGHQKISSWHARLRKRVAPSELDNTPTMKGRSQIAPRTVCQWVEASTHQRLCLWPGRTWAGRAEPGQTRQAERNQLH